MISVVTPWRTLLSALGLIGSVKSECVLMSMKPGATARPSASITLAASSCRERPSAAIRPSRTAISPISPGRPLPSIKVPPRIRMSQIMAMGFLRVVAAPAGEYRSGEAGSGYPLPPLHSVRHTQAADCGKQERGMRTGAEYRQALRDGRRVWDMGEGLVEDLTTHPATRAMVDAYVA